MSDTTQKPIFKKQLRRGIAAAVFENTHNDRVYRSVNLQRSYYKDDAWHRMTLHLAHEDIPFLITALEATWDFLNANADVADVSDPHQMPASELA